jgi:hypothetical protein
VTILRPLGMTVRPLSDVTEAVSDGIETVK